MPKTDKRKDATIEEGHRGRPFRVAQNGVSCHRHPQRSVRCAATQATRHTHTFLHPQRNPPRLPRPLCSRFLKMVLGVGGSPSSTAIHCPHCSSIKVCRVGTAPTPQREGEERWSGQLPNSVGVGDGVGQRQGRAGPPRRGGGGIANWGNCHLTGPLAPRKRTCCSPGPLK